MARSARPLLALLWVVSGCSGLRGCGASAPESPPLPDASVALAPVAADAGVPQVAPPPPELLYARLWLVIVHSSATPGEGGGVLAALKRTGLPVEPKRLPTTAFRDLRPCLEVLVARAFEDKAEALAFQKKLLEAGMESYVKNAGPLEADREGREAACRAGSESGDSPVAGLRERMAPRFVESHAGRTFLLLGESRESRALEPMDARRSLWMGPVEVDPTGLFVLGDKVDLYSARGPLGAGCAVRGFAWINRGVPHAGYFRQEPVPEAPGCGRAWAFAELDCELPADMRVFALPAGTRPPVFFEPLETLPDEERVAQWDALKRTPRTVALRAEGAVQAERVQEELSEEVRTFGYAQGERQVLFTVARFRTGEGNAACGTDYEQQVTRALLRQPQSPESAESQERLLPFKDLDGDDVMGVLDLEGDGQVELLLHSSWPADTVRLVREDGSEVAGAVVENCDYGC